MKGDLARLIPEPERLPVAEAIHRAVRESFVEDQRRDRQTPITLTRDEVKRRFNICLSIYVQLRGDLKWGQQRVFDHLGRYLRFEIDKIPWEPDKRRMWSPGDGK